MPADGSNLRTVPARVEAILDRLADLEVQGRGLVEGQTVEAKEFVVKGERGHVYARLEMQEYWPRLVFYDGAGDERLSVGLRSDGSPSLRVKDREIAVDRF